MGISKKSEYVFIIAILLTLLSLVVFALGAKADNQNGDIEITTETLGPYNLTMPKEIIAAPGLEISVRFSVENATNESWILSDLYMQIFNATEVEVYNYSTGQVSLEFLKNAYLNYTVNSNEFYLKFTIKAAPESAPNDFQYFTTSKHNILFYPYSSPFVYSCLPISTNITAYAVYGSEWEGEKYRVDLWLLVYNPNNTAIPARWYINGSLTENTTISQTSVFYRQFDYPGGVYTIRVEVDDTRNFTHTWRVTVPTFNIKPVVASFSPNLYTIFIYAGESQLPAPKGAGVND